MHKFCKQNVFKIFAYNPSKKICTFLVFPNYTSGYLNFANIFAYLKWHGQGFLKYVYIPFFGHICLPTFLLQGVPHQIRPRQWV